jgi:hypothetical protein
MKANMGVLLSLGLAALFAFTTMTPIGSSLNLQTTDYQSSTVDDEPVITIDASQGLTVFESLNVTGFYIDEHAPTTIGWQIHDAETTLLSGDLSETLSEPMSTQSTRMKWQWSIDVNISGIVPCSCILELSASDSQGQQGLEWLIIFGDKLDFDLQPQVLLTAPLWTDHISGDVTVRGFALDDGITPPIVQWSLTQNEAVSMACMQSWIQVPDDINWLNSSLSSVFDGSFMFEFDTTQVDDGAHILLVRTVDSGGSTSRVACVPVGVNNQPPVAVIKGPVEVTEDDALVLFDGSSSEDPVWGRGSLIFVWTLEKVNGVLDDRVIDSGLDKRTFSVSADDAGNWRLTLTVADQGGLTDTVVHEFNISNVAPTAVMRIDGQLVEDGSQVTLSDSKHWTLNAAESTDTANDIGGLTYTWYIDGEAQMLGSQRYLARPDDLSNSHTISLAVTDDDGATDWVTVTFGVENTPSDPMTELSSSSDLNFVLQLALASLFLTGAVLAVVLVTRRGKSSVSIPKWKSKKDGNEKSDQVDIDQTDEVENGEERPFRDY